MFKSSLIALLSVFACFSSRALAQTGTLDQASPFSIGGGSALFNAENLNIRWQQQVRVGIAGKLEGFKLRFDGVPGGVTTVHMRLGNGWSTSPICFQTWVTKSTVGQQTVFVDTTAANISLAVGATFVIELYGSGSASNPSILSVGSMCA